LLRRHDRVPKAVAFTAMRSLRLIEDMAVPLPKFEGGCRELSEPYVFNEYVRRSAANSTRMLTSEQRSEINGNRREKLESLRRHKIVSQSEWNEARLLLLEEEKS
jgi:hypothetical protein